ncbi:mannosyl-glycoprotein endo-beta-N-acetylglucosaminidase [Candidatus Symbiothrix dinenymphae]|nr:mannosyl-glycoprotein endo-beta-N-acetylglucosaminidase [Candidatus Symbiothrix dinenymphae]
MKHCLTLMLCLCVVSGVCAQKRNADYEKYINQYSSLAMTHMQRYKIPASITLAQGLLESRAGKAPLVREANNHFGIKCHNDWNGKRFYQKDDGPKDCFRVYKRAEDSFDDHSRFLAERQRYASLFSLNIRNYQAWAKGLKRCGYATDPNYANKLIKIIEDYELYRFDKKNAKKVEEQAQKAAKEAQKQKQKRQEPIQYVPNQPIKSSRQPYKDHGLVFIFASANDSYESIAKDLNLSVKKLVKWNEVPDADFPLFKGDIVYLEKKKKKADLPNFEHRVEDGESMHSISQMYGIQLKRLYKLNHKKSDYVPDYGEVLKLR